MRQGRSIARASDNNATEPASGNLGGTRGLKHVRRLGRIRRATRVHRGPPYLRLRRQELEPRLSNGPQALPTQWAGGSSWREKPEVERAVTTSPSRRTQRDIHNSGGIVPKARGPRTFASRVGACHSAASKSRRVWTAGSPSHSARLRMSPWQQGTRSRARCLVIELPSDRTLHRWMPSHTHTTLTPPAANTRAKER